MHGQKLEFPYPCRDCGRVIGSPADCYKGKTSYCKACHAEHVRATRAKRPEYYAAQMRAYQARRPEMVKEAVRNWQARNRERRVEMQRANWYKRRARLKGVVSEPYSFREIAVRDRFICYLCGGRIATRVEASIDHVIPISRGGNDTRDNIRLAHLVCNRAKWAHSPIGAP